MCLGVPAEVLDVRKEGDLVILKVRMGGVIKEVISGIPDIRPGEYVIVHAGVAISRINKEELEEILNIWQEMGSLK